MTTPAPGLEFRHVSKFFGASAVLRDVSFSVPEGEAHALVGENGAGKSTLLKILAGIIPPDRGGVAWRGELLSLASPKDALERGIGMVYQEMLTFPNLTVAGNLFAGRELTSYGRLREREMHDRTGAILDELHLKIAPGALAASLSAAHRQLLQVARALAFDCRILVLDEPTTALTHADAEHLFTVLEKLKAAGVTLLYVSHRLPEVLRLCDGITILRDGAHVGTFRREQVTAHDIIRAMVGRDLPPRTMQGAPPADAPVVLQIDRLTRHPCFRDVSLAVRRSEIVGLFGLVGSGRSELLETIFGVHRAQSGEVRVSDRTLRIKSPAHAARADVALVPEERQRQGLLFNLSLRHNLLLPLRCADGTVVIRTAREYREAQRIAADWRIRAPRLDVLPDALSGGNQQKVVAAKW
ncbi:MAG TPA: sugar ABC transporter ATP-binding protein, partial [Vicinamibacterales bacterium]|nr:sugar ABC transporter ATP-binding protein [Vicinamibacterales bacterium]